MRVLGYRVFRSLSSWSVESGNLAYDDARQSRAGIWYFRDVISRKIRCFADQERVVPLFENRLQATTFKATLKL